MSDTVRTWAEARCEPVTANAYLGGWGIARALAAGADVVVCGRVTDASVVVGPAAWGHGWAPGDRGVRCGGAGRVVARGGPRRLGRSRRRGGGGPRDRVWTAVHRGQLPLPR